MDWHNKGIRALACILLLAGPLVAQQNVVTNPPQAGATLTLTAVYDQLAEHNAFSYAGKTEPPLIRVSPGGTIQVRYVNNLPVHSDEKCALGPCENMSNLHFHGLHVSPQSPQDDVLTMMAMPGQVLNYRVDVPFDAPPGLYWYHTHPHGESARQDLDGMSGAIVVEGIDRYYPQLRSMPERVLVLRDRIIDDGDDRKKIQEQLEIPRDRCGKSTEQNIERVFTLNGAVRPLIPIRPGERQFWRIVNASPDRYADIQLEGQQLEIVALDGMPLSYHDHNQGTRRVDQILIAPAGRVEAIVSGPMAGTRTALSTRCVDSGPDGDNNPAMVLADVVSSPQAAEPERKVPALSGPAVYKNFSSQRLETIKAHDPDFTVVFTEDKNGFYINGKKFAMDSAPMLRARVGSVQHWRVVNATGEVHPFHIHQVHFLAYAINGDPSETPEWLDTVNVPYGGAVDLIMDFTDPVIRGVSVFHCHLLSHEDKGMMAKIVFE
jgi:FtsP/CotA-like multicopper oxidase with cupredoxin domain